MSMPQGTKRSAADDAQQNEGLLKEPTPAKRPSFQGDVPAPAENILEDVLHMAPIPPHWQPAYTLGKGGFGRVILVHTNKLNSSGLHYTHNEFVTKHMNVSADGLRVAVNEVKMHRKCRDHPNILFSGLSLCQRDEPNGGYQVQMCLEYAACGNMWLLSQKPKHEQHVAYVCEGVLKALKHVHSLDIVHGDITLTNVLMTHTGVIKLCDFGFAKYVEDVQEPQPGVVISGTPGFIAPEILNSLGWNTKADMWSVAWFTVYLKTGNNPWKKPNITFDTDSYRDSIDNRFVPEIPEDFSNNLKDFIKQMSSYHPEERSSASPLLQHAFLKSKVTQEMIAIQYKRMRSAYGVDLPYPDESQPIHVPVTIDDI